MLNLEDYVKQIQTDKYEILNLGIKDSQGNDVFIKVKNHTWGDFVNFVSEFSAVSGKRDAESLKKSEELALKAVCRMVVNDNGENYLTVDMLNSLPVMLVNAINNKVSEYINKSVNLVKSDNVDDLKKS